MKNVLLAIFAHPDDESFGSGGTLAYHAAAGADVHLICATKGESGKITDPNIDPTTDKAALRENELKQACEALGIHPPIFLGYQDSGRHERTQHGNAKALMNVDIFELEQTLLKHIQALNPQVILTFDPHGIYGHIDHIQIHRAATAAFWSAAKVTAAPPKRLFYSAMASERMKRMQALRPNSPLSDLDADIYGVDEAAFAVVKDISAYKEKKQAAIESHRSQVGPQSSFRGQTDEAQDIFWQEMFSKETFTLGGLRGNLPNLPLNDFFAGLA